MKKIVLTINLLIIFSIILNSMALANNELKKRGFLGVVVTDTGEKIQKEHGLSSKEGVLIQKILPGSTASEGDIKEKDIILEINKTKITNTNQFLGLMSSFQAGNTLEIIVLRVNKTITVNTVLKPMPKETSSDFDIIYTSLVVDDTNLRVIITKPYGDKKYPAILFIPGLSCISVDYPFVFYPNPYKSILYELTKKGFVTMRVEKSGMGDSGGISCREVDFNTETKGFRKGLEQLKNYDFVDKNNVFIFGHSMGGVMAPVIAKEIPVKGVIVFGTVAKIWTEYETENTRRQEELVKNRDFVEIEKFLREKEQFLCHFYLGKHSPEEIMEKYPNLGKFFEDKTHLYGRHYKFFHQLYDLNLSEEWKNTDSNVLAIWGEADFVSSRGDHELIANIVNSYHPGKGTYLQMKNIDHAFHQVSSMEKSFNQTYEKDFNNEIINEIYNWINKMINYI